MNILKDKIIKKTPCARCKDSNYIWDRIGNEIICVSCQEKLASGSDDALIVRLDNNLFCDVCNKLGAAAYLTKLKNSNLIEINFCKKHFSRLICRDLKRKDFEKLKKKLSLLGIDVDSVFLLHDLFYRAGFAIKPIKPII
jgi:hypothetical protein